jgi:phosphoserine phosphatase
MDDLEKFDKLAALDMDGTIIQKRTVDVLTEKFGMKVRLKRFDGKFGHLKEYQKADKIAEFFKGFKRKDLLNEFNKIPLSYGIEELIAFLKRKKFIIVIITNSYKFLASEIANRLGIKLFYGNVLEDIDGILTGKILMPLGWAKKDCKCHSICKFTVVQDLARKYNIKESNVLAIGDSENDYCMLKLAGIAVSYNNKSKLLRKIPNIIVSNNFYEVLSKLKERIN